MITEYHEIDIEIEPGMSSDQEIVFRGEGEPHVDGEPGDLKIKLKAEVGGTKKKKGGKQE